jgi:YggT family protein
VNPDPYNPIVRFLHRVTEPVLRPIRYRLPATMGLDLSPIVVIVAIKLAEWVVVDSLRDFALSIR